MSKRNTSVFFSSKASYFLSDWSCQFAFAVVWSASEGFVDRATSETGLPQRWSQRPSVACWDFEMDLCSVLSS